MYEPIEVKLLTIKMNFRCNHPINTTIFLHEQYNLPGISLQKCYPFLAGGEYFSDHLQQQLVLELCKSVDRLILEMTI